MVVQQRSKGGRMRRRGLLGAILMMSATLSSAVASEGKAPAAVQFRQDRPGVHYFVDRGRITRVYGAAFSTGDSAEESAGRFAADHSMIFGVPFTQLVPGGPVENGATTLPVMYEEDTGTYKFTLVYFSQVLDGIPVFRSDLRLLVRNEPGFPLVLASSSLHDLGDFQLPPGAGEQVDVNLAFQAAQGAHPELTDVISAELVIWAGIDDAEVVPTLAISLMADNGLANQPGYSKWLCVVDAQSGELLYDENQICHVDIVGNVSGMATPTGVGADICGVEISMPMPYARVLVQGGNTAYADKNGNFTIPHGGSSPVTVESGVRGQWFRVRYSNGTDGAVLTQNVTPPGPANFMHNQANNSELLRAEVNAYVQSNIVRDFALVQNPNYPTIWNQQEFRVNVNISSTCNAYYDGSSINFYRSGGGCANTAFDTVVHHEYGHHMVQVGGSGQGAYGEGMGDVMGVLITDDPILAYGFQNNCNNGIRNANNNLQYPCSGEIHYCGQLISGCVWSTRDELLITNPGTYLQILSRLAVNSILMHSGDGIAPDITIDFLTLDDNDNNIGNGTPHYAEIAAGFGEHNMDAPPLDLLRFTYPNGVPTSLTPNTPKKFQVRIEDLGGQLDLNSPRLNYRVDGGGFSAATLNNLGNRLFEATIPGVPCRSVVEFYLSASTTGGGTDRDPEGTNYAATSGASPVFVDTFETDLGWTVQNENLSDGAWERGVPAGGGSRGDPPTDYDGSGRCYLTANRSGNSDVDGGPTRLTSPTLDLSAPGEYTITYARWFYNDDRDTDRLVVEISNNNGSTWTTVESVGHVDGWVRRTINVADYLTPTATVRMRFSATDNPNNSVTEAALDAFSVQRIDCRAGGVTCDDISRFKGKCKANGTLKGTLILFDESKNGQTVAISIDGTPFDVTVVGQKAVLKRCCYSGAHTVALTSPAGCPNTSVNVSCP